MTPAMGCTAAWYELNISSADNCVSACCYYAGKKDPWSDDFRSVDEYWNSPNMQTIRRINSDPAAESSEGCANCYFFKFKDKSAAYFPDFLTPASDLSPAQRANWLAAIDNYQHGRTKLGSGPLRYYVNFGFACNLYCTMCHQVPRRKTDKRQVQSEILLKWKPDMLAALDVTVIGGEPFVIPDAVRFMQAFITDPDFESVQLSICTNGTMHDKHMDLLSRKRKLQLTVSLDTIGEPFEKIRIGASWAKIERNILQFIETGKRLGYNWPVQTPCLVLKSNISKLVDFVDWAVANGVSPSFYDFIGARGIEKTFEEENVLAYPYLVEQVPGWQECFSEAVAHLRAAGDQPAAAKLDAIYVQVTHNLARWKDTKVKLGNLVQIANGKPLFQTSGAQVMKALQANFYGARGADEPLAWVSKGVVFRPTHLTDHLTTPYLEVPLKASNATRWIRVRCAWPADSSFDRCKFYLQDGSFNAVQPAESRTDGLEVIDYFEVPVDSTKVRLVLTANTMEPVYAPSQISVDRIA